MSRTAKSTGPEVQAADDGAKEVAEKPKEKYYRMKFHAKSSPNDQDDVVLSVNGESVVIERQKEVVLPERYKVCAENARSPQFRQMPNQTRKIVGEVITFPFDLLGEGTEEQYLEMKRSGTKATRDAVAKDGAAA
ncbi:MAG: hypothetical protein WC497_05590 [Patescibacteria group bacterium]